MKIIFSLLIVAALLLSFCANKGKYETQYGIPLSFDSLYYPVNSTTSLRDEPADRVTIRTLIDAWAHYADRRLAKQQSRLFTDTGVIEVYQRHLS